MFAGLPELTAYYLLNEGLEPETLFRHCKPPNREGLITQPPKSGKGGGSGFVKGSEDSSSGLTVSLQRSGDGASGFTRGLGTLGCSREHTRGRPFHRGMVARVHSRPGGSGATLQPATCMHPYRLYR